MVIADKYLVLHRAAELCVEAYQCEEEPGQFLYSAMQYLVKHLEDLDGMIPMTPEEQIILWQKKLDLQTMMAKNRQELGYTPPAVRHF